MISINSLYGGLNEDDPHRQAERERISSWWNCLRRIRGCLTLGRLLGLKTQSFSEVERCKLSDLALMPACLPACM